MAQEQDQAPKLVTRMENVHLDEERLVAELEVFGISYLSRGAAVDLSSQPPRSPSSLIADFPGQRSARVRSAIVALLLVRPDLWPSVQPSLELLSESERHTLMLYYTAAVWLQRLHAARLRLWLGAGYDQLPDLFGETLGVGGGLTPAAGLRQLARSHVRLTGSRLNWEGSYRNVAERLLRQWRLEAMWRA